MHYIVKKSDIGNPSRHWGVRKIGLFDHLYQKFSVYVDSEMYPPNSVSKVFYGSKYSI